MALSAAAEAIGAGVSAIWSYFRSEPNSGVQDIACLSEQELQNIVVSRGEELHVALLKTFGVSNDVSRALSAELATLLRRLGFNEAFLEFKRCTASELASAEQIRLFFRANTFSTRLVMDILRTYGQIYLEHLVLPLERYLANLTPEEVAKYEIMPSKIELMELNGQTVDEFALEAQKKFQNLCDFLLDTICATPVPLYLKYMIHEIHQQSNAKWPASSAGEASNSMNSTENTFGAPGDGTPSLPETFDAVGGVLVLRLIIPALASLPKTNQDGKQMIVIRACQILQSLSNEVYMRRELPMLFINEWMRLKMPIIKQWKQTILDTAPDFETAVSSIPNFQETLQTPGNYPILAKHIQQLGLAPTQETPSPSAHQT